MKGLVSAATVLLFIVLPLAAWQPTSAQSTDVACADFDAWEWAQAVFESEPEKYDALDPDGDGTACPILPKGGFAPAFWMDKMPEDVEEAKILRIIDGDTFEVEINGVSNRVRIYRADTPETQNEQHCGGQQATDFATWALSFNDEPGVVYIEKDKTEKDRYGRELAYIWFEVDGQPYLLNHVLINNGYAEDVDYGDRMYDEQFKDAQAFAKRHDLGVWGMCGGFDVPLDQAPAAAQAPVQQPVQQPAQEAPAQQPAYQEPVAQQPVVQEPVYEAPAEPVYEEPAPPATGGCDPNYTPCVPLVNYDLNCPDIGFMVQVIGGDPHGFDRDRDGWGCETYG